FNPKNMDTSVIAEMMKTLRLPIWLNGNTNFYVDKSHAKASDKTDGDANEGRGLSASLPFASINACAAYIANNFNIGPYTAYINVADACYEEQIVLPEYSRTTGQIIIKPAETGGSVRIKTPFDAYSVAAVTCSGGVWDFWYPKIVDSFDYTGASFLEGAIYAAYTAFNCAGGRLSLLAPDISANISGNMGSLNSRIYFFRCSDGTLRLNPDESRASRAILTNGIVGSSKIHNLISGTGANSIINFGLSRTASAEGKKLYVSGAFTVVADFEEKASFALLTSGAMGLVPVATSAGAVTGVRYEAHTGATINVLGRGAEFFPGDANGSAQASTNCWYQ
ncbi:MAG: hypothetical protein HDQ93_02180, partial [Desulfovibrio sp.]|nr:hypothetical protein [Desulfovibrio sp.]